MKLSFLSSEQSYGSKKKHIFNPDRLNQRLNYCNLRWDKITPTDIDGFIDFKNQVFVFFEIKYKDNEMPQGQELALERLVDNLLEAKKKTILIIASHDIDDPMEDIDVSLCQVEKYRYKNKWILIENSLTLIDLINSFKNKFTK